MSEMISSSPSATPDSDLHVVDAGEPELDRDAHGAVAADDERLPRGVVGERARA